MQRYRCQHCHRNFSSQTFSPSYWLKRPELLRPLFFRLLGCSALRQIAREFGVESWAQFFLKFAAAHPDVTTVTPATSKAHHMLDNMAAGLGRLPDASEQQRMIEFIEALPEA